MASKKNLRENVDGNKLDLSMSELTEVPVKEIAAIKKATCLDLSNNELTYLPRNFSSLTHLIELDLSKNSLQELPDNFGDLVSLKRLDLYGNQLTHLPLSFSRLKALKWLDLKNNPLLPKLADIAGPCGDTQQCQQCARNIVSALSTALKMEEDRKRLLEEQLKEKELMEQALKKELEADNTQKKKKKNKKGKGEKQPGDDQKGPNMSNSSNGKPEAVGKMGIIKEDAVDPKKSAARKNKDSCHVSGFIRLCFGLIFWSIFVASLLFTCAVTFALYDRKQYQYTMEQWGPHFNSTTDFVLQSAKVVEHATKHPFLRAMRLQLTACFRSIIASMLNIYKTVSQEFPAYYEIIKSKFA